MLKFIDRKTYGIIKWLVLGYSEKKIKMSPPRPIEKMKVLKGGTIIQKSTVRLLFSCEISAKRI